MATPDRWSGLPGELPDLEEVRRRITPFVRPTLLQPAPHLEVPGAGQVWIKDETRQATGSFKVRGAASFLTALSDRERALGVVTCSSGNHGRAVAFVAARLGIRATVFVPQWVDPVKLEAIRGAGADTRIAGSSYDEAEAAALLYARNEGAVLVPPFDDPEVIAGQGSVGLEILEQLPDLARVVVPLSGGGLVAGIGLALSLKGSRAQLVAVSARRARVMRASLEAGFPVELPEQPTLAGALAGGIGMGNRWTLPLVHRLADHHLEVDEEEIAGAMAHLDRHEAIEAEGGGAVGVAAVLSGRLAPLPGNTVVVVSGGNVDPAVLGRIRNSY